uniref:PUM-HD domain-containing protein n=1 Tax=Vitis vinifera TaxID=29760 RepID=A5B6J1_VITVI|nr:hypothetical protein VITISV_015280 [Vitis vinifera]
MKDDEELERLLGEIPHATSNNHHHLHREDDTGGNHHHGVHGLNGGHGHGSFVSSQPIHGVYGCVYDDDPSSNYKYTCASPVSGFSLQSDGSSSSLFSCGRSLSDNGSPTPPPLEDLKSHIPCGSSLYPSGLWLDSKSPGSPIGKNANDNLTDGLSLSRNLSRMYISNEQEDSSNCRDNAFWLGDPARARTRANQINVEKYRSSHNFRKGYSDYLGHQFSVPTSPMSFGGEISSALPGLQQEYGPGGLEDFTSEDSFIIQGEGLNYVINKGFDGSRGNFKGSSAETGVGKSEEKMTQLDGRSQFSGICENGWNSRLYCPFSLPPKYNSLVEAQGHIYMIAKDQHGCRFLQRMFDEGTPQDVQIIFNEIIDHVVELMMNPFGNYLMQKLLDVCNEEQRMQILVMLTEESGELVRISLNTHGTRVVQKLIETLKTRQQISRVISALEPGFLALIKDLNGNHVIQRCLQCLSKEDNKEEMIGQLLTCTKKFIFVAAAKYCVEIATHQHGCCVLQRCISHSTGEYRENLVAEISSNGFLLAQDAFGNYVVQFILELKIPSATSNLIAQFEGNYVHLSTQRFSSHVVEKCLTVCTEENQSRIVHELLSTSHFEQLLQHPHANYVIQKALQVYEGKLEETCNIYFISSQGCIKSNMGACAASAPKGLKAEFHAAAAPARAPAPLPEKVEAKVEEVEEKKADGDGKEKVMDENSNNNTSKNDIEIENGSKQPHQSLGSLLHGEVVEEAEAEAAEKSAEVALVVDAQESEMSEEKKQRTEEG